MVGRCLNPATTTASSCTGKEPADTTFLPWRHKGSVHSWYQGKATAAEASKAQQLLWGKVLVVDSLSMMLQG